MYELPLTALDYVETRRFVSEERHFPPHRSWEETVAANIPLAPYVERFIRSEHAHRLPALRDAYTLILTSAKGYTLDHRIFRDCFYTIMLAVKGDEEETTIACVGFDTAWYSRSLTVGQLQGVAVKRYRTARRDKHVCAYLMPLQWEQMLLAIVCDYAREAKFRAVRVIPATKQAYYGHHSAKTDFVTRYERTALALGFTKSRRGYHTFPLTS